MDVTAFSDAPYYLLRAYQCCSSSINIALHKILCGDVLDVMVGISNQDARADFCRRMRISSTHTHTSIRSLSAHKRHSKHFRYFIYRNRNTATELSAPNFRVNFRHTILSPEHSQHMQCCKLFVSFHCIRKRTRTIYQYSQPIYCVCTHTQTHTHVCASSSDNK